MRMLDLCCGEGLAAWGYWLTGRFSEIVGVDVESEMSSSYSFNFICADFRDLTYDFLLGFDFIHVSPPCQAYSKITPDRSLHQKLIKNAHLLCVASGVPYVIENVEGSGQELRPNMILDGHAVNLPISRRRYFHVSTRHTVYKNISSAAGSHIHGDFVARDDMIRLMGLDVINPHRLKNITVRGMKQGVPPLMTKFIAESMFAQKAMIG